MGGILSDTAIRQAIAAGDIEIDPYEIGQLNVTSYDLTLGSEVRVYSDWVSGTPGDFKQRFSRSRAIGRHHAFGASDAALLASHIQGEQLTPKKSTPLDVAVEPVTEAWAFDDRGFVLQPGIGYLMHTQERVRTTKYNPILDGKSSIGRLFIQVHATAGYGDPGFSGQFTLEVLVRHPVRVYPGMRIAQIRFHTICGELGKLYDEVGHYVGEAATGAKPSQAWKQFLPRGG
jgi:dCTP deaminase